MVGMYILEKKVLLIGVYKLANEARGIVLHTGIAFDYGVILRYT